MITKKTIIIVSIVSLSIFMYSGSTAVGEILYVDDDAIGANDGASWENAYQYLQDALENAQAGNTICVAEGIYKPDQGKDYVLGDRDASFRLKSGVRLMGGYAGLGYNNPDARNIHEYKTVLSGDLQGNDADTLSPENLSNDDTRLDNSYRILRTNNTDTTTEVNGFIIEGGYAKGNFEEDANQHRGGGIYHYEGDLIIRNCIFKANFAYYAGGAIYTTDGEAQIFDCTFISNSARVAAGAVCSQSSDVIFSNCVIEKNLSADRAGGIYSEYNYSTLTNCIFTENTAYGRGGAICNLNSHPYINNCNFSDNLSHKYGGGIYNEDSNSIIIGCSFNGNDANDRGGAIFNMYSHLDINDCDFADNLSHYLGGGVHNEDSDANIIDCRFNGNTASGRGGAICNLNSHPYINNCNFSDNLSHDDGGGINNEYSNANITNCRFTANTANDRGGAIFNLHSHPDIHDCNFTDNLSEDRGGGIYCCESEAQISQCRFHNNEANSGGGLYNYDSNSVISDCNFISNTARNGGGGICNVQSNPALDNCIFLTNSALKPNSGGGAIRNDESSPTLKNCTFAGRNWAEFGGAIYNSNTSNPMLVGCKLAGNAGYYGGGMLNCNNSKPRLINCIFTGNCAAEKGGAINNYSEASLTLTNCTFAMNTAVYRGGAIFNSKSSTMTLTNCIIWYNDPNQIDSRENEDADISYSCIEDGWISSGAGNISTEPMFVDADGVDNKPGTEDDNVRLLWCSPCIDSGNNNADTDANDLAIQPLPDTDIDGNKRFVDELDVPDGGSDIAPIIDMGAYEGIGGAFRLIVRPESITVREGRTATFTVALEVNPSRNTGGAIEVSVTPQSGDTDITVQSGVSLLFTALNYSDPQTVVLSAAQDDDLINGQAVISIAVGELVSAGILVSEHDDDIPYDAPGIIFVDQDAPGTNHGRDWGNAFRNLRTALNVARYCPWVREIRVAAGTYTPPGQRGDEYATFELVSGVALCGGYAGYGEPDPNERNLIAYETILSGDIAGDDAPVVDALNLKQDPTRWENTHCVVTAKSVDSAATLDGFTITGGNNLFRGGGMYNFRSSPKVVNCTFIHNSAFRGGGMANKYSSPTVINCTFTQNYAYRGGGISNKEGHTILTNCWFLGNVVSDGGGAVYNCLQNITLANCVFSGNLADFGGAIWSDGSTSDLVNCTFSGNEILEYKGRAIACHQDDANEPSNIVITNCILWDYDGFDEIANYDGSPIVISYSVIRDKIDSCYDPCDVIELSLCNIHENPLFMDIDGDDNIIGTIDDDLGLRSDSPCIDKGNDSPGIDVFGVSLLPGVDADLRIRRVNASNGLAPIVDIGAFEFGSLPISSVLYIDNKAKQGKNNGTNWQDAFLDLQTALRTAFVAGDRIQEIWVASGTYTSAPPGGSRGASFNLVDGVGLFGGFLGDEISRETRDPNSNLTILSGDLQGDDGLNPANNCENSYHVVRAVGVGPATILDGFIIEGGNADANESIDGKGGGLYIESASPEISNCVFWDNTAADYGSAIYAFLSAPTFFDCMINDNHSKGIWMEYGQARIEGAVKIFSDVLGGNNLILGGQGMIELSWNGHLNINDTRIQCDIVGPGVIEVDAGHELVIESDAIIELSSGPWGEIGQIWCDGLLLLREQAGLYDADVYVSRASVEDEVIIDNCVISAEPGAPYGQFFIEDQVKISLPAIIADGDRYLDLDPSQEYHIDNIKVDIIDVYITEGTEGTYGGLFELRGIPDLADSGRPHPDNEFLLENTHVPPFNLDTWTINRLELTPGAKLNLTNRFDFQSRHGIKRTSEVLYVRELILRENSILNTAFNTVYCEIPPLIEPGARMLNVPLLGFSLNNITFDDESEYSARVIDNNFKNLRHPEYNRKHVEWIPHQAPDPNGMMCMRVCNIKEGNLSSEVVPARAKGLFDKSNDDHVLVMFEYLFVTDEPGTYLNVYLSDKPELVPIDPCSPEWVDHHVYVGSVYPPRRGRPGQPGRPGSVGSGRFGTFHLYANSGGLNFIKGTRVELELIGPAGTSILINNWDPFECRDECMNLDGQPGINVGDLRPLITAFGSSAGLGSVVECIDGILSGDGYVDCYDLISREWAILNQNRSNLCPETDDRSVPLSPPTALAYYSGSQSLLKSRSPRSTGIMYSSFSDIHSQGLVILGKMRYDDNRRDQFISEGLYFLNNGSSVTNYQNLGEWPYSSCNIKLVNGLDGGLYQINIGEGVCRLDDGSHEVILASGQSYSIESQGRYNNQGGIVYVGLQYHDNEVYGRPIWDVVVTSNYIYAVPVVVKPDGNDPYLAAARFERQGGSEHITLYDDPGFFDERIPDNPDLSSLREIEVDSLGNVYVLNSQGLNSSEVLWKYSADGDILLEPLELTNPIAPTYPIIRDPVGLCVSSNTIYLASGLNEDDEPDSKVYAFDTMDLTFKGSFIIRNMEHVTDMTWDALGNLWIVGVNVNIDIDTINNWKNVTSSFYEPCVASISANELALSEVIVSADPITGDTDLGLPLSVVWTGGN